MKIKKGWYLGIALIACVLLLIIPASAYSILDGFTLSESKPANQANSRGLYVGNLSAFSQDVTRITWTSTGPGFSPGIITSGHKSWGYSDSCTFDGYGGNCTVDVDVTCSNICADGETKTYTWDVKVLDFPDQGEMTPHMVSILFNGAYWTDTWNSFPTWTNYTTAHTTDRYRVCEYVSSYDSSKVGCADGSYTVYGGAPVPPTPTPTPTATPTPAPGNVRTTFYVRSATTGYMIHGPNIMLYDTYRGTWTNSTSDADGILYIDTLPYTDINAYATYTIFENEFADAQLLGASAGATGGSYDVLMYPISSPPPAGYVNLFVSTQDGDGDILRNVNLLATWNSIQHNGDSGLYGTMQWVVPNNTQVHLVGWKTGYEGAEETINTGTGTSYSTILYLNEEYVTPTPTTTATTGPGGTIPVTPDTRSANEKDVALMDQIRVSAPDLVGLAIIATMMGLLGMIMGSFKK